jgi:hypothetical protein
VGTLANRTRVDHTEPHDVADRTLDMTADMMVMPA